LLFEQNNAVLKMRTQVFQKVFVETVFVHYRCLGHTCQRIGKPAVLPDSNARFSALILSGLSQPCLPWYANAVKFRQ
jgi:hypothetical protein